MNLIAIMQDQLGPMLSKQASALLGLSANEAEQGVRQTLPALLGGLIKRTSDKDQAANVFAILTGDAIDNDLGQRLDLTNFSAEATNSLVAQGQGLLGKLLGDDANKFTAGLASLTGLGSGKAGSLLGLVTPFFASGLRNVVEEKELGLSGFMNLMSEQKEHLGDALGNGAAEKLGLGSISDLFGRFGEASNGIQGALGSGDATASAAAAAGTAKVTDLFASGAGKAAINLSAPKSSAAEARSSAPTAPVKVHTVADKSGTRTKATVTIGGNGADVKSGSGWWKILPIIAVLAALAWMLSTCRGQPIETAAVTEPGVTEPAANDAAAVADDAASAAATTAGQTADAGDAATASATEAVAEASDKAAEVASAVVDTVAQAGAAAADTTKDAASATVEAATDAGSATVDAAKDLLSGAGSAITGAAGAISSAVSGAAEGTSAAADSVATKALELVETVKEVDLPDGTRLSLSEGSPVDQIVRFLKDADGELPKAFILRGLNFETASSRITTSSEKIVDDLTATLKAYPSVKVRLEGHTDNRGKAESNQALSASRAAAVRDALTTAGISSDRVATAGFGPGRPIADNETSEGQLENRRVEVIITER